MNKLGTAANVIVQHPHSIKYANSLSRAVLSADSKHGKRCSIEGLKLYFKCGTILRVTKFGSFFVIFSNVYYKLSLFILHFDS